MRLAILRETKTKEWPNACPITSACSERSPLLDDIVIDEEKKEKCSPSHNCVNPKVNWISLTLRMVEPFAMARAKNLRARTGCPRRDSNLGLHVENVTP